MNAVVAAVLVQRLQCGDIGSIFYNLIDPLDALDHFVTKIETD